MEDYPIDKEVLISAIERLGEIQSNLDYFIHISSSTELSLDIMPILEEIENLRTDYTLALAYARLEKTTKTDTETTNIDSTPEKFWEKEGLKEINKPKTSFGTICCPHCSEEIQYQLWPSAQVTQNSNRS